MLAARPSRATCASLADRGVGWPNRRAVACTGRRPTRPERSQRRRPRPRAVPAGTRPRGWTCASRTPALATLDAGRARAGSRGCAARWTRHRAEIDDAQRLPGPRRRHRHEPGRHPAPRRPRRCAEARPTRPTRRRGAAAMARGAVLGARGNSGVIVSQMLRGLAETSASAATLRRRGAGAACNAAAERPSAAVAEPGRGHDPDRGAGGRRRRRAAATRRPGRWSIRRASTRRARRWPHTPDSWPCWPGPAWSTPAAGAWWCCSSAGRGRHRRPVALDARSPDARSARALRSRARGRQPGVRLRGAVPARRRRRRRLTSCAPRWPALGDSVRGGRHRRRLQRPRARQRRRRRDRGRHRGRPPAPAVASCASPTSARRRPTTGPVACVVR